MWLREQIGPQAYTVNSSILLLGLNKDEHPSPFVMYALMYTLMKADKKSMNTLIGNFMPEYVAYTT